MCTGAACLHCHHLQETELMILAHECTHSNAKTSAEHQRNACIACPGVTRKGVVAFPFQAWMVRCCTACLRGNIMMPAWLGADKRWWSEADRQMPLTS
eukprot:scaffold137007_cov16-Tisochrysis_lutea.AAC.1